MSPLKCSIYGLLLLLMAGCAPVIRYGVGDPSYFGPKRSGVWLWVEDGSGRDPCPAPHIWMNVGEWYEVDQWLGPIEYQIGGQPVSACVTRDMFEQGVCSGRKDIRGRAWEPVIIPRIELEKLGIVVQTEDMVVLDTHQFKSPEAKAAVAMAMIDMLTDPNLPVAISITDLQAAVCPPPQP